MIGLDTNVLLRFFLKDDPGQNNQVIALISSLTEDRPGYVNCITLMEFAWVLRKRIRMPKAEIAEAISDLLDSRDIVLEDEHVVEEVLAIMESSEAEFADVFIALRNRNAHCSVTKTFDVKAARLIPGMELLT